MQTLSKVTVGLDGRPRMTSELGARRLTMSFEAFYEREYRSVVGLVYALSGSGAAAEDLAQDAFLAAHRRWERISAYENPGAWVRRVASNLAVSQFRRRVREARAVAFIAVTQRTTVPELDAADAEFWTAVRALPKRQAQAVALYYLEDLPVAEIAEVLECSEGTVKAHLHKARRALATRLGESE